MLRKTCVLTLLFLVCCIGCANAELVFTLNPAVGMGMPGDTVTFTGTLTNTYDHEVFLNGNSYTFSGQDVDFSISGLLGDVPFSLLPFGDLTGADTYSGAIFDVQILPSAVPGTYFGSYSIIGGADDQAQDELASANFRLDTTAVPEPSSMAVMVSALAGMLAFRRHRN